VHNHHRGVTTGRAQNTTEDGAAEDDELPPNIADMRATAAQLLGEDAPLPRWEDVQRLAHLYRRHVLRLIPAVEAGIARRPKDDVPAAVARACIDEARRRLDEIEAPGLDGETKRTQRLARSVLALADHWESLGGTDQ
jgi:hypothetical protein